jgi:CheY-like chemotaxis protein
VFSKIKKSNKKPGKKKILFIDKDPVWMNVVKNALESLNCKVLFLRIPEEKKQLYPFIKDRHIDVVISEIDVPGWDGFSEVRQLREEFGGKVKIALTAKNLETNHKAMALAYKADCLFRKTDDAAAITSVIKKLM